MLSRAFNIIYNKVNGWLEIAIEMLPNFVVAVIVLLVFYIAAKYIKRFLKRFFQRFYGKSSIINLFSNAIFISVLTTGLFVSLSILNLDKAVTSLLAGVGIVGLALGFAFQEIASNFISGVILSINKPFTIGDIIAINDIVGTVEFISLRTTNVRTFQGQKVLIPNKIMFQNPIINYTENGQRRVDLTVGVSYGEDLEFVQKIALQAIDTLDDILKDEKVQFFYTKFDESSVNFTIMYWTDYSVDNLEFMEAQHRGIIAIRKAFRENDISIPFPIRTLDFGIKGGEKLSAMLKDTPPTSKEE